MKTFGFIGCALLFVSAFANPCFCAQINSLIGVEGKLPESVQQEVNSAVDRAVRYVAGQQRPDGTWPQLGEADADWATLSVRISPISESEQIRRRRLDAISAQPFPQTNSVAAYAARSIFLALSGQTNSAWQVLEGAPLQRINPSPDDEAEAYLPAAEALWTFDALFKERQRQQPLRQALASRLRRESETLERALADSLLAPTPSPFVIAQTSAVYQRLADPDLRQRDLTTLRIAIVLCNSHPEHAPALLRMPGEMLLDWRQLVAESLVARQRIDPATGYGYWSELETGTLAERIRATSLALHILAEL